MIHRHLPDAPSLKLSQAQLELLGAARREAEAEKDSIVARGAEIKAARQWTLEVIGRLRGRREDLKLSIAEVADSMSVDPMQIEHWESSGDLNSIELVRYAAALGLECELRLSPQTR